MPLNSHMIKNLRQDFHFDLTPLLWLAELPAEKDFSFDQVQGFFNKLAKVIGGPSA